MGKTFKDRNKNTRYRDQEYDDYSVRSNKFNKQDAKRFRQDRSQKRCVKEDDPVNDD